MKITCTCGCARQYSATEIHDTRVIRPLSKACITGVVFVQKGEMRNMYLSSFASWAGGKVAQ